MHGAATHRDGPHGEGHDVSGAGDGDADAGVAEAVPQPLRQAPLAAVRLALEVVDALHDHEHVVNTDTCNTTLLHYVDYSILCKYERRQICLEACVWQSAGGHHASCGPHYTVTRLHDQPARSLTWRTPAILRGINASNLIVARPDNQNSQMSDNPAKLHEK